MKRFITMYLSIFMSIFLLIGCGTDQEPIKKEDKVRIELPSLLQEVNYIDLRPSDTQVVTTTQPTFTFERSTNNSSSNIPCSASNSALHNVEVKIIKIESQGISSTLEINQTLQVPNECQFSIQFPSLILEENVGYAWRVSQPHEDENLDTVWNSFVYSTQSMGLEDDNPHSCEKNMVKDWSFLEPKTLWRTTDTRYFSSNIPINVELQGDDDNGSARLVTPNEVAYQVLAQPIIQGKYYQLKFSLKHEGKANFKIKALAFNGNFDGLEPDANMSIIGFTGTMTPHNSWVKVTLNKWRANKNFSSLAIALVNDDNQTVYAKIDRVCLVEVSGGGCAEEVDTTLLFPDGFDLNNSDPIITPHEYLAGSVNDLYPQYDTTTANWFEDANQSIFGCSSLGGDLTDEEEAQIDAEMLDPEFDTILGDVNSSVDTNTTITQYDDENSTSFILEPIVNNFSPDKCTDKIVDTSKPFSGRDIVYIHGLQVPALKGNLKINKTFQEKWPQDKQKFYTNGDIIKKAKDYWGEHIERELGVGFSSAGISGTPSNSFLVVSWSANQRVRFAIHAVLTQIKDAMVGNNPNVYQSDSAKRNHQCFGDNGIVVVTHSTGGLIASSMFGIAQHSNDSSANITTNGPDINIHNTYGDVRFITDKIDAQIGINAAYGGSPFAETAIKAITTLAVASPILTSSIDPITRRIIEAFFQKVNFSFDETLVPVLWKSSLVDLIPHVVAQRWRIWQSSDIPTLTMSGTFLGKAIGSPSIGGKIISGFDDLVLSASSQSNSYVRKPRFEVKNRRKLKDRGVGEKRRRRLIKDGKKASGIGYRNYYNTPYIAPTGMLQGNSVKSVTDPTNWHIPNHHLVLQTTGDHFDNVNEINRNNDLYAYTKKNDFHFSPFPPYVAYIPQEDEKNYEETGVVFNPALYSSGLLSSRFGNLNQEWIRDETWGFHFVKITFVIKEIKFFKKKIKVRVPKFTWHYYEFVKWRRKYHLLKDYQTKIGADYLYEYILRP